MTDVPVAARRQAWRWLLLIVYVVLLTSLAVAWHTPALHHWLELQSLGQLGARLLATPLGPLAVMGGYVVAVMLGMPVLVLTSVGALVFEPWPGMAYAMLGMLSGAWVTYGIGRFTGAQAMDRWTRGRLALVSRHLHRRGLSTVIAVRVLPVAPFIMINMVAGALRVRQRDYLLGTFIGLTPATISIFLLMDRLTAAWRAPGFSSYVALLACVVLLGVVFLLVRRKLLKSV